MSDLDDLHETVLKLTAKGAALETWCIALFTEHPARDEVAAKFSSLREQLAANTLNDADLKDEVPAALEDAHAHIAELMRKLSS